MGVFGYKTPLPFFIWYFQETVRPRRIFVYYIRMRSMFVPYLALALLLLLGGILVFNISKDQPTIPYNSNTNPEVYIELNRSVFRHNGQMFEPVTLRLVNNTSQPMYYLTGCAVTTPTVYTIVDGNQTPLLPQNSAVCMAMPQVIEVLPHEDSVFGWNQQIQGEFVPNGQYQLAVNYSFEKTDQFAIGGIGTVISDVFTIEKVVWGKSQELKICDLYDSGFHSNDFYYSKQDCLNMISDVIQHRT